MNYTIYNTDSGEIFSSGNVPDPSIQEVPLGFTLLSQRSDPATDYVVDGMVVPLPPKPGAGFYKFDYSQRKWVGDEHAQRVQTSSLRNSLLQKTDWTQLPDVPLETKEAWATYRQALRDITEQQGYPFNVIWPTPPG